MTLTQVYELILKSAGCTIAESGAILLNGLPVKLTTDDGSKELVIPTKEVLRAGNWSEVAAFHPMCEYIYNGQSEVLNLLTELIGIHLCDAVLRTAVAVIGLAANTDVHEKLKIKQTTLISKTNATKAVIAAMTSIASKHTGISGKYPLLSLRLDRSVPIDDESFARVCVIVPHILLPATNGSAETFVGTEVTKPTAATIRELFLECIPSKLRYGNNSASTPYLFALLDCYYHFAQHLNELTHILGKYTTVKIIDTSWYEYLPQMKTMQKTDLPQVLPYNRGGLLTNKGVKSGVESDMDTEDEEDANAGVQGNLVNAISGNRVSTTHNSLGLNKIGGGRSNKVIDKRRNPYNDYEDEVYDGPLTIAQKLAAASRGSRVDNYDDRRGQYGRRDVGGDRRRGEVVEVNLTRRGYRSNR